jgi:hypothetical protein
VRVAGISGCDRGLEGQRCTHAASEGYPSACCNDDETESAALRTASAFGNELFHDGGNDRIAVRVGHRRFLLGGRNIPYARLACCRPAERQQAAIAPIPRSQFSDVSLHDLQMKPTFCQ